MEILQLKYFQVAARLQNFSQAAEELNITQPSLSITISRLENEMNIKLFNRKGRNVELNESGMILLDRVNKVFCELESAKSEMMDIAEKQSRHISLATTSPWLLSGILKNYLELHSNIVVNQRCEVYETIEKHLNSGEIDFCLTLPPINNSNIECKILKVDETVLVVPKSHRFAGRENICLSEAANESFITLIPGYNYRNITDSLCYAAGFTPKIAFEVDDLLMKELIELERGILLLPLYVANSPHVRSDNFSIIKINEPNPLLQIGLSWQKGKYLSLAAKQFKKFIIENYNQNLLIY